MKTFFRKHVFSGILCLTFFTILLSIFIIRHFFFSDKVYYAKDFHIEELKSGTDKDGDGIDDYTDILLGARSYISSKPKYKSKYYSGGYPDDGCGVCTDVIWQALQAAGYSLKEMVDEDIASHPEQYPSIDSPDPNIDFRRVRNLDIFFQRNALSLPTSFSSIEDWQAGDIVVFKDHIAICSDKRNSKGIPFILHHSPMGAEEKNDMERYAVLGHYRLK